MRSQKFAMGGLFWGLGAEPQRSKILHFFCKNNLIFRAIVIKNIAFKTWHRNWQYDMIQLVALMFYVGDG